MGPRSCPCTATIILKQNDLHKEICLPHVQILTALWQDMLLHSSTFYSESDYDEWHKVQLGMCHDKHHVSNHFKALNFYK